MKKEQIVYKGFLFFGLIKVGTDPYVIEYNCRLGDPETEAILPRLKSDLLQLLISAASGTLGSCNLETDPRFSTAVMLVSKGYPGSYEKGKKITGLETVNQAVVFHAGTARDFDGTVVTTGGRVMAVNALGDTLQEALSRSYENAAKIHFEGKNLREDIGFDLS